MRLRFGLWAIFFIIVGRSGLAVPALATIALPVNPLIGNPDALRIRVSTAGLQQIDGSALSAAGWNLSAINPRGIHVWRAGQEVPIELVGAADGRIDPADTIRFVGKLTDSRYSRDATYWLSYDGTPGLRGTPELSPGDPVRWEEDTLYSTRYASVTGDHWFGRELATVADRSRASIMLALPTSAVAGTRLQIALASKAAVPHSLAVSLNGRALTPVTWNSAGPYLATWTLPWTILPGSLQVDLQLASPGTSTDTVFIDSVTLPDVMTTYAATPVTPMVTRGAGIDPRQGPAVGQPGASYLIISHSTFRGTLDPLITAHQQRGDTVGVVDVQTAYDAFSFGDRHPEAIRALIRTATTSWQPAPRAVLLVGAGSARMRVAPGEPDPTFIPPYLVNGDPVRGEIACDTCYTRLVAGDVRAQVLPDLPIGRFPVRSLADAQALVRKTVSHLTMPPGGIWQSQALLLADNDREPDGATDPAGSFVATAETAARLFPPSMQAQRYYFAPDRPSGDGYFRSSAELRCRLMRALDGGSKHDMACPQLPAGAQTGAALWVYVGHASMWQWGVTTPDSTTPYLWYLYDADGRKNGDRLPILLSMTCLTGDWANPTLMTTDERMVLWPTGGAVASLASTGEGVNTAHARLLEGLLPRLFASTGERRSLGEAHLAGLRAVHAAGGHDELAFAFGILGDPDVALPFVASHAIFLPNITH